MRNNGKFLFAVVIAASSFAIFFAISRTVIAQSSGRIQSKSQIRTAADPSAEPCTTCDPTKGEAFFVQDGPNQTLTVKFKNVPEPDLYVWISTNFFFDGTNSPVSPIAPMDRTDKKKGNWSRKLVGTSGAPPEFQQYGITNLSDIADLRCLVFGNPGETNIIGGTNFIECVITVTNGVSETVCFTNVQGGATNILVDAFVWAPIPPLVIDSSVFSFNKKIELDQPTLPPSPHARGNMRLTYNGPKGSSLLDIQASGLIQGQGYVLWVSDAGTNVASGNFDIPKGAGGSNIHFRRDTGKGEALPLQAPSSATLTNRLFTIRDATGGVHLFGVFP